MFTIGYMPSNIYINATDELRALWKARINDLYLLWRGNTRKSVSDFARYLSVPQPVMNGWINHGAIPGPKYFPTLASHYPWIYAFFGLDAPKPEEIDELSALIPSELTRIISAARAEYISELSDKGITSDSPEGREIIKEVFSRHGVRFNVIE